MDEGELVERKRDKLDWVPVAKGRLEMKTGTYLQNEELSQEEGSAGVGMEKGCQRDSSFFKKILWKSS